MAMACTGVSVLVTFYQNFTSSNLARNGSAIPHELAAVALK